MDIGSADSHPRRLQVEVPVDYVVDAGSDDDAGELVDLLRGGRELPVEFVQRLPVIDSWARSPRPELQRRAALSRRPGNEANFIGVSPNDDSGGVRACTASATGAGPG